MGSTFIGDIMEAYKTTCPDCSSVRYWTGYKTGIGKTPEQLEQMEINYKTCRKCGSTNAITDLDRESENGRTYGEQADFAAQFISGLINKRLSDQKTE